MMSKDLPISLDLRITGKCNLNCNFCFGACPQIKELNVEEWLSLLDVFWEHKVRGLVMTGGEPTLYKGLIEIITYAKKKGFFIALSSNGTNDNMNEVFDIIDALSLPMDGKNYEQFSKIRGITRHQYDNIKRFAKQFKHEYPSKVLKIGTVVTRENYRDIEEIYRNVIGVADVWKLYQVSRHKRNEIIYDEIKITEGVFDSLLDQLKDNDKYCPKILFYNNNYEGKYLFCEPNGDAMIICQGQEVIIGNFISEFDKVCETWGEYVSEDLLAENFIETYCFPR